MKVFVARIVLFMSLGYGSTGRLLIGNSDRFRSFVNVINGDVNFERTVDKIKLSVLDTCSYRSYGRVVSATRSKFVGGERRFEVLMSEDKLDGGSLFSRCLARYNQYKDQVQQEIGTAALALVNFASDFDVTDKNPLDTIEDAVGLVLQSVGRTARKEIRTFSDNDTLLQKILNTPASYGKQLLTGEFVVPELFNGFLKDLDANDLKARAGGSKADTLGYGDVSENPPFIMSTDGSG